MTLVARPRVERQIREAVQHASLTVLQAPLGAGKTSAAQLALQTFEDVVWTDAQPWHTGSFVRAIVESIRARGYEDIGRMTLGALESGSGAARLGQTIARELARVTRPMVVVVDNIHVLEKGDRFFRFVDAAVSELNDRVKIVAIGRSLPPALLLRTFARKRVTILDPHMLKFDSDELAALARAFGRDMSEAQIAEIAQMTEGWAAGAVLAMTASGMPLDLAARHLISDLGRENVRLLEELSIFETIDPSVTGAGERLADMRRRGVLLDEVRPGAMRLHPMLREILLSRLRARGGESQAHAHAARAYAQAGNTAAAFYHACVAGDEIIAAYLLRTHTDAAIASGDNDRVAALAETIDPSGANGALALYAQALLAKARSDPDALEMFDAAATAAEVCGDAVTSFAARAQILQHDIGMLADVPMEALDDLAQRAKTLSASDQVRAAMLRGWAYAVRHDFDRAIECVAPFFDVDDDTAQFNAGILRAYVHTARGEVQQAQDTLDALIARFEQGDTAVLQTLTLLWFARLALVWGSTTAAAEAAAQAQRLASALELRGDEASMLSALCELASHHGDVAATVRYAEFSRDAAQRAWYAADRARIESFAEIALARAAFLGHDNAIARDLALRVAGEPQTPPAQRAIALSEAAVYSLLCEPTTAASVIDRARSAIASAKPVDAADAAALATADDILAFLDEANGSRHERLLRECEPFGPLIDQRRGLITLELVGVAVGNARRGSAGGTVAFDTGIDLLTSEGPRFEASLARAYASTFIRTRATRGAAAQLPELTTRENEILELLVEGCSNKEIAQRLVVSPRTIETHVERILGKLQVGSRSRAIAKAVRTGLIAIDA